MIDIAQNTFALGGLAGLLIALIAAFTAAKARLDDLETRRRRFRRPNRFGWCLLFVLLPSIALADPKDAVVRFPSHGGSGTVIESKEGYTLILSCAHMLTGSDLRKPLVINAPSPAPGSPRPGKPRVLKVNYQDDLSLILLEAGPLPYVCPVAPAGFRPGRCLSVGFDLMRTPPQVRHANIIGQAGAITFTREKPWHGRSGGALIDERSGLLVGVVQGYTGPKRPTPPGEGVYASHAAILAFLGMGQRQQDLHQWRPARPGAQAAPAPHPIFIPTPAPGLPRFNYQHPGCLGGT